MALSKELFVKSCKRCEKTFRTDDDKIKECPSCREKRREYREQYKSLKKEKFHRTAPDTVSLDKLTAIIEKYNTQHGTCYTYGQFVCLVHNKKIEL